ncbi:MAG: rhomboid family intramembrane serine protease [Phycisphaerae bacterium]|nr:rhomboid family intramembrane serine protease [Phycisphaerae bacterium]
MFFPVGTSRPHRRHPAITTALIAAIVGTFLFARFQARLDPETYSQLLDRVSLSWKPTQPWRFVTYAFAHADWWHVISNAVFLWVFGPSVEDRFGHSGFLAFFLAGSALSGLGHVALSPAPVIGASGAISAVTGAYLVLFPRTTVRVLFLIFFSFWDIPATWFIIAAVVLDFLRMGDGGQVAHGAHLAGYLTGFLVAGGLLATRLLPREPMYDLISIWQHRKRRQELRAAVTQGEKVRAARLAPGGSESAIPPKAAERRARVSSLLAANDRAAAADEYELLLSENGVATPACLLSRRTQFEIASTLYQLARYPRAMIAFELFARAFANDPQTISVRLLMAAIATRHVKDHPRARTILDDIAPELSPDQQRFAADLRAELDPADRRSSESPGGHP